MKSWIQDLFRRIAGRLERPAQEAVAAASSGRRVGLCYGINDYPGMANDLSGCVNDARGWGDVLTRAGYAVTLRLDGAVTREAVLGDLRAVVGAAAEGDRIVMTYSGHGSQTSDLNGDEDDGRDETLYVHDGDIRDDELGEVIKALPEGVALTLVFDSCHSGTATRAIRKAPRRVTKASADLKEVLISGCLPAEYSYDSVFGGRHEGAFSHYALSALRENPALSCRGLWEAVRESLPSERHPQTPSLYGAEENLDRGFF